VKRLVDQSYYELLEIPRSAPPAEVERAYERAKALYGPGSLVAYTLLAPDDAELLSQRIEEARSVLLDVHARASYDARLPPESGEPWLPRGAPAGPPDPHAAPPEPAAVRPAPGAQAPPAAAERGGAGPVTPAPAPAATPAGEAAFELPDGAAWSGEMLRRARESRGWTVMQVSERTKVTRHHIENIEMDRFEKLPVPVYLRGILMSLARELRLDAQKVARTYLERAAAAQKPAGKHR